MQKEERRILTFSDESFLKRLSFKTKLVFLLKFALALKKRRWFLNDPI